MSWNRAFRQFLLDLKFWLFCLGLFQVCRLVFLFRLSEYIAKDSSKEDILLTILNGLRFDFSVAGYAILIPFLFITVPSGFFNLKGFAIRFRFIWGGIIVLLTAIICIISIEYYKEYHNVFDDFLFGLIYDDRVAILKTILATYRFSLLLYFGAIAAALFLYVTVGDPWLQETLSLKITEKPRTLTTKIFISLLALVFLVTSGRGSVGRRPIQLKDAGVTRDSFLNKAELNPYTALRYAIESHGEMQEASKLKAYIDGDLKKAASFYFRQAPLPSNNLDDYAKKKTKGATIHKPEHIFLIVMESYGTWPLLEKYAHLGVSDGLRQLAKEGIFVPAFVSASNGTMSSLSAIITGLPDAGIVTNYQKTARVTYPTAIAPQFKKLGYKTQMFYGGYLPWERIADFSKDQGFDEVYGAANMGDWLVTKEWGVDDDVLFNYINAQISKTESTASGTATFTVIMSTSNHPPFNVDLDKKGIDLKGFEEKLTSYKEAPMTARELGHFKYADQELLQFVKRTERDMPNSLFVITGDHYGRRHVVRNPSLFEKTAVPLVLYGQSVLGNYKGLSYAAGSHNDIATTLIEMIAPKGYSYTSYGRNIFDRHLLQFGLGQKSVITPTKIFSMEDTTVEPVPFKQQGDPGSDNRYPLYKKIYNTALGLTWWRIIHGPNLSLTP